MSNLRRWITTKMFGMPRAVLPVVAALVVPTASDGQSIDQLLALCMETYESAEQLDGAFDGAGIVRQYEPDEQTHVSLLATTYQLEDFNADFPGLESRILMSFHSGFGVSP